MASSTLRDPTVILSDHTNYSQWLRQLKTRCQSLEVWKVIEPTLTNEPLQKPIRPQPPLVAQYHPLPAFMAGNLGIEPSQLSHLSTQGAKAYKEDQEVYKILLEDYKITNREYQEEKVNLDKVVTYFQTTVSAHIQHNCCTPGSTIRQWVESLMITVGVDPQEEHRRARVRYLEALRPMRTPGQWSTWLSEYDHAATEAESNRVAEAVTQDSVKEDFVKAVRPIAPIWVATFQQHGREVATVTRKAMMKLFRDYMSFQHPNKGKQKGAFAAAGSYLADGGESTQATDRDASLVDEAASSKARGRPRNQRRNGHRTKSKRTVSNPDLVGWLVFILSLVDGD
ncbi:gag protein [Paraphaeosphaeria sporulosa]